MRCGVVIPLMLVPILAVAAPAGMCEMSPLSADDTVKLAMPFSDGAVLQRDRPVPVWGTAAPGERVTVSFAEQTVAATADADGRWRVTLAPMPASKTPRDLSVVSSNFSNPNYPNNPTVLHDLLVGEVWLASGQSNMELPLWGCGNRFRDADGAALRQFVRRPHVRFLKTANYRWSATPVATNAARWTALSPENVGEMSAVAFYFAETLNRELDVPVGIVGAYWGGTGIDPWIPSEGFAKHPKLVAVREEDNQRPSVLYNAQIAPVVPYAIRGAIWYQGCYNALVDKGDGSYGERLHALYDGWTQVFGNADLKLYLVQIAPFDVRHCTGGRYEDWFELQLQQARFAREMPNAGLVVTSDVRSWDDIHPHSKQAIGRRLAMMALKRDYGFADVVCDSPEVRTATVQTNCTVRLEFDRPVGGWFVYRDDQSTDLAFELRDEQGAWHPAAVRNLRRPEAYWNGVAGATDDASLLIGWTGGVEFGRPTEIRYMHTIGGKGDLYTTDGLPLGPFAIPVVGVPEVSIDASRPGAAMPNTSSVLTFWNGVRNPDASRFEWAAGDRKDYPITGFVRYCELMACTGGNASRDLFKNPDDRTTLDDYDFEPLVAACRKILRLGMKPYLKLGNVPRKYSSDYAGGEFSMNIRPPSDDRVHYRYMRACAAALKAAFGRDEVRTWRFAVLTEADNTGWFKVKSGVAAESREAMFRLYDFAALAFEEELGGGLAFGTHLLDVEWAKPPQSQFTVEDFVAHCAHGTNAANGRIGAPLGLLTMSYYAKPKDGLKAGRFTGLVRLRKALADAGFTNVVTGVDEGRVIVSTPGADRHDLPSRAVGASYEAAFDVRVAKSVIDAGSEYFATWGYFTGPSGHFSGVPSHHYFSCRELARLEGLRRIPAEGVRLSPNEELDALAGISADGRTLQSSVARFHDQLVFTNRLSVTVKFSLPSAWAGREVSVETLTLDDRNNWFEDWRRDRVRLGIEDKDFSWSPDDWTVLGRTGLKRPEHRKLFVEKLQPGYARKVGRVRPVRHAVTVGMDGRLSLPLEFVGNGASHLCLSLVDI